MVWANEYMHTDDVADLLHETQAKWLEEREQMVKRHGEVYASWLASNEELNDAKAEIARLNKASLDAQLYCLNVTYARDETIARLTTELDRLEKEHARGL